MENRKLLKVTFTFGKDKTPKVHINDEVENLKREAKKAVKAEDLIKLTDITERARLLHKDLKRKLANFQADLEEKPKYPKGGIMVDEVNEEFNPRHSNVLDKLEEWVTKPVIRPETKFPGVVPPTGMFTQDISKVLPGNNDEVSDLDKFMFEVSRELDRQDQKWGSNRDKHPLEWQSILMEEVGEVANEINESNFDAIVGDNYIKEIVQVAACAFRMYEQELRNKKPDSGNNNTKTEI
jgi:NTP pyrophosphatase (non-canonical NTP hydrolase)